MKTVKIIDTLIFLKTGMEIGDSYQHYQYIHVSFFFVLPVIP